MKTLAAVTVLLLVGIVAQADDSRTLAGQSDFSADYLEKITDERKVEEMRREQDRKDHIKYLRQIDRSRQ